ncbi:hypothetical protein [Mycolicibacterium fluoranthenivorans]|uniref:Uncharacterized protein n=1 Tax=Mycolicibacterium fluoranthenivorans TaxID=258505 RepID=A0A1G4WSW2_9MYCO|nr:hypothetical protein [Mycolicibacterium fluoranthenivorans]SCX28024.1 hypothetical protein SAMN02799620_04498 [Mycolicibacterium fluoranthenivorans]
MPLTRFDPPADIDDLDTEALRNAWSEEIDETVTKNRDDLQAKLGPNHPAQFFNELTDPKNMADRVEQPIMWQGFPRLLEKKFGENSTAAFQHAEDGTPTAKARQDFQDEYLEWHVTRDGTPASKIVRVEFTCEGPEYWKFLGERAPDKVVALYQQHVDPSATRADLFPGGIYDPLNKWNTGRGAMHLIQGNNTLGAEVNIGAFATIKRKDEDGAPITDADKLIRCAKFGAAGRASDPHIGDIVNSLARQGYSITIKNPIGLYIHAIDLTGFTKPDGTPVTPEYFTITRGSVGQGLRAIFAVPPGETTGGHSFTVSDIAIGGIKIAFGGQIAKHISMKLTGVAVEKGKINNPLFGCGAGAQLFAATGLAHKAGGAPAATRVPAMLEE